MNYSFFADIVADMLKMEPCRIKSVDKLNTDTQLASCDIKKRIVYVKRNIAVPDALFAISHEMRHIWQAKSQDFKDYKSSAELSIEDYNLQPEEIDANAFAKIIMEQELHLSPQFTGLSDVVKEKINERAKVIKSHDL